MIFRLLTWLLFCASVTAAVLEWDPNTEPDLAGYRVHWGPAPRHYTNSVAVTNATEYDLSCFATGQYFFALTAYNHAGLTSEFSDELSWLHTNAPACPPAKPSSPRMRVAVTLQKSESPLGPWTDTAEFITWVEPPAPAFYRATLQIK